MRERIHRFFSWNVSIVAHSQLRSNRLASQYSGSLCVSMRPYLSAFPQRFDPLAPFRVFDFPLTICIITSSFAVFFLACHYICHTVLSRDLVLLYQAAKQPVICSSFVRRHRANSVTRPLLYDCVHGTLHPRNLLAGLPKNLWSTLAFLWMLSRRFRP